MPNVIISADSTCDLSPEQREHYQVRSFPFHIEFRGRDHLDNIDITPQVLFDGFYEDKSLPQTGACSPEAYRQHFAELTADGSKVVHFNLGSALSSAYENASAAAADMEGVYVIDGKSLSTGIGLQVLAACRMRDAGMSAADIAREASELHNRSHASFVLDTMEFLAAGGRCPTLVAYLGGKLSCRPGILVDNQSGVLARVSNLFCRRGFNIDTLTVSATNDPAVSRITLTITSDDRALKQLILQTERLEVTQQVFVLDKDKTLQRELLLLKVASDVHNRAELREIANIYKAKIIDLSPDSMVFELIGKPDKIDAFLKMFEDYEILEQCRTGVTALERGGMHQHMQKPPQEVRAAQLPLPGTHCPERT